MIWANVTLRIGLVVGGAVLLMGAWGHLRAEDALVLAVLAAIIRRPIRCVVGLGSVALSVLALPPALLPTYWVASTPLVVLWRSRRGEPSQTVKCGFEAFAIAFTTGWLSTSFIRAAIPTYGWLIHGLACVLYGCQFVPLAVSIHLLRGQSAIIAALGSTAVGVAGEFLQAYFGVSWSITSLSLPAASSPVAQWAHFVTQFGVSGILYLCSFLVLPDRNANGRLNWTSSILALCVAACAVVGGNLLVSRVNVAPPPFCAMLVQPHCLSERNIPFRPWEGLETLTQSDLDANGPVDLIVWPESALAPSLADPRTSQSAARSLLTLQSFVKKLLPSFGAAALAGVVIYRKGTVRKYGLEVPEYHVYNCACLAQAGGELLCQEKLSPIPWKESLPEWLDFGWFRSDVLDRFGLEAPFCRGEHLTILGFKDRLGRKFKVVAPICYESFLPWLPYYRRDAHVDAVVHLCYDGFFAGYPECAALQQWACQYRAIETRKWNLLCTTWSGSAVIDPAGHIRTRLPGVPGVLRTDRIDAMNSQISD
jgi:apolipoprotein N-acyltransferase